MFSPGRLTSCKLYGGYADPYDLDDMKLLIIKVSNYRDPQLVASTWRAIFYKGM